MKFLTILFTTLFLAGCPEKAATSEQDTGTDAGVSTDAHTDAQTPFDQINFDPMEIKAFRDIDTSGGE